LPIAECRLAIDGLAIGDWRSGFAIGNREQDRRMCDLSPVIHGRFVVSGLILPGLSHALPDRMNPKALELQARTQRFAEAVIRFCQRLPKDLATQKIVGQLLDSAGSTDSNYRATCRARSPDEFIAKVGVAAEEADESKGWLQLLVKSGKSTEEAASGLIKEADELTAIFVASRITAQRNQAERKRLETELRKRRRK
jgi:four helix bundle protein